MQGIGLSHVGPYFYNFSLFALKWFYNAMSNAILHVMMFSHVEQPILYVTILQVLVLFEVNC